MTTSAFVPPGPVDRPELFFALVGPTGTDLEKVVEALKAELQVVGYHPQEEVRLSSLLMALDASLPGRDAPEDVRIGAFMDAGDAVRKRLRHGGSLAALAVARIRELRGTEEARAGTVYLLRSLKHPKEIELLRAIYGASLIVISVYEAEEARRQHLKLRIMRSNTDASDELAARKADELIARDLDGGTDPEYGQNVRKAFPLADFFVDIHEDLRKDIGRLVRLFFAHPEESPTPHEYAMFSAQAVALRSADMSRQVGAVVVDGDGEVLAAGCNEVPKPGGGIYWTGDRPDGRDFTQGSDANARMGHEILHEVFVQLKKAGWLEPAQARLEPRALVESARRMELFDQARVANLIEFGRVVHAEMNALVYAARRGIALDARRLYCTTFPCHVCARHIIGAGIAEVVYIEPYPKSLAVELYPEAITLGEEANKVRFRPFTGVAPRRYLEFFGFGKRKDGRGFAVKWGASAARPRARQLGNPHLWAEKDLLEKLWPALQGQEEGPES
jgi:deoxycytidylate deaminase